MAGRTGSTGPLTDEALATLAMAGVCALVEGSASPTTGAAASYTITDPRTKRLLVTHMGCASPAAGDIRYSTLTTATANSMPLYPQRYMVLEVPYVVGSTVTVSFFNTGADTVKVYCTETP
jgi:hypothetical protein